MANIVSGLSLGALTGILIGLSASPVVGSVLGSLITGIIVFLSLTGNEVQTPLMDRSKLARLTAFSLSTILFMIVGICARSGDWLGRSEIQRKYDDLKSIGFSEKAARDLVVSQLERSDPEGERARSPILWSSTPEKLSCAELDPSSFADNASILESYMGAGEPWSDLATLAATSDQKTLRLKLQALYDKLCR